MDDTWKWYRWNSDTLKAQGLDTNMLRNNEYFYINYAHGEVIHSIGTSYKNKIFYSLTGLNYIYENN